MAVNASFLSRSIESVMDVQGLMINVYYHLLYFGGTRIRDHV